MLNNSKIDIFEENINKSQTGSFEATDDELCAGKAPLVRLYTTSTCGRCKITDEIFQNATGEFAKNGKIDAAHWNLDIGDNMLTAEIEKGVPKNEVALFKKYSPRMLVPATIIACKYKKIGALDSSDEDTIKLLIKGILGE